MPPWRMAKCLDTLLAQINEHAPNRSKASDGGIGDAAHASTNSDHNPWVKEAAGGVVTARDFTHDPAGGMDCAQLAQSLSVSGDPRIKYIIWYHQIWNRGRKWVKYVGRNPHTHHLHLSVSSSKSMYDSTAPWKLQLSPPDSTAARPVEALRRGSKGEAVKALQQALGITPDGVFGPKTEAAVKEFQRKADLVDDGIAGVYTLGVLYGRV